MAITLNNVEDVVNYHKPSEDELAQIGALRSGAAHFIRTIVLNAPPCADTTAAIRKVREALMTANAAIVLRGLV